METAITITLFFHLLGMASLVGGSLAQLKEKTKAVTPFMLHGALTQLVTGFMLVGFLQANNEQLRMGIVGTKMTILAVILLLIVLGRKKLSNGYYFAIVSLSIVNVALALFVTSAS
jgi:hypothetical protein